MSDEEPLPTTKELAEAEALARALEGGPSAPPLPAPPLALLETQARAASGRADLSVLDREMRTYRESVYATLGAPSSTGGGP